MNIVNVILLISQQLKNVFRFLAALYLVILSLGYDLTRGHLILIFSLIVGDLLLQSILLNITVVPDEDEEDDDGPIAT